VAKGFEAAFGAALADDLKAPEVGADQKAGWATLDGYSDADALPSGCARLAEHISAPPLLARRLQAIRLAELNAALEQAEQDLQAAQAGHQTAASELASINAQEQSARAARKQADHVATAVTRRPVEPVKPWNWQLKN